MEWTRIEVRPLSAALGAEIRGVDLSRDLDARTIAEIAAAFVDYGMIFFRNQNLDFSQLVSFARRFGELDVHPIVKGMEEFPELVRVWKPKGEPASFGVGWHSDNSFFAKPSKASLLYGVTIPPYGGDTLFASMEKAFASLSPAMQRFLEPLHAVHSAARAYDPKVTGEHKYRGEAPIQYRYDEQAIYSEVVHPVIRKHPESGRKSIFVNPMFTQRIVELSEAESRAVLDFLFTHSVRPEFTCRLRWEPRTLAVWDNRSVQHYAMDDYRDFERLMYRATVRGDEPV
jgi:taurine dioxygenase